MKSNDVFKILSNLLVCAFCVGINGILPGLGIVLLIALGKFDL